MSIVKLSQVGESVTWKITGCETVAGKFGAQVKFTNDAGDVMYVSADTAERQLERSELTVATAVGETLVFSRDENKKTPGAAPYWSIKLASGAEKQAAAQPSKRLTYQAAASGPSKGSIPEMDDFPSEEYGQSVHSPDAYDDPRPLPAFHKPPTKAAETAPEAATKMARARQYLDLLAWVQAETKLAPEVAQPVAATIWIDWKQAGLVK
jgi:hypothetical protein